jgi:hypothetical protein
VNSTYPEQPGFKTNGTSEQAADSVKPRAEILRERCLEMFRKSPLTADECAEKLGESVLSIRPRVTELSKLGKVRDTGVRRKNESGRGANVWIATDWF